MEGHIFDKSLLREFIDRYTRKLSEYISYGVMDRQDVFRVAYEEWKPSYEGIKTGVYKDNIPEIEEDKYGYYIINRFGRRFNNPILGYLYKKDCRLYICYPACRVKEAGVLIWGKHYFLLPLSKDMHTVKEGEETYTYSYNGEAKKVIVFNNEFSIFDCLKIEDTVNSVNVKESILDFFSIVQYASQKVESRAAVPDMEASLKLIFNMPTSPLRFLPALGHQCISYIANAFGIEGSIRKENDDIEGYDCILRTLKDIAKRKNAAKAVNLIYYHKSFRNQEAHRQLEIKDPVRQCEMFLLDHIVLVYILKYLLREELKSDVKHIALGEVEKAEKPRHMGEVDNNEFIEKIREELKDHTVDLNKRIVSLEAESKRLSNAVNDVIDHKLKIKDNILKELKTYSTKAEYEYIAGEIEGIKKRVALLEERVEKIECDVVITTTVANTAKNTADDAKNTANAAKNEAEGATNTANAAKNETRKQKNNIRWIITAAMALLLLAGGYVAVCTIPVVAETWGYPVARASFLASDDLDYNRAVRLEEKLCAVMSKTVGWDEVTKLNISEGIIRNRKDIAEAYRRACVKYEYLVEGNPHDNAERAYRLALMYFRAKGGMVDNKKALRYATVAAEHIPYRQGLKYVIMYTDENIDDKDWRANLALLRETADKDPYASLALLLGKLLEWENSEERPSVDEVQTWVDSMSQLAATRGDCANEVHYVLGDVCMEGIENKKGECILSKDFITGVGIMNALAVNHNYLPAILAEINYSRSLNLVEYFSGNCIAAYTNGFVPIVADMYRTYGNWGFDKSIIDEKFSFISEKENLDNFARTLRVSIDEYQNGHYEDALSLYKSAVMSLPAGVKLINIGDFEKLIAVNIADSAKLWRKRTLDSPVNGWKFLPGTDSIARREARKAYIDAYFHHNGYGGYAKDESARDSLLRSSSNKGLVKAIYARGVIESDRRNYGEAAKLMQSIASVSDDACVFLAEHYRRQNPDLSMEWVGKIKDTLSLYKNVREVRYAIDCEKVDNNMGMSKEDFARKVLNMHRSYNINSFGNAGLTYAFFETAALHQPDDDNGWIRKLSLFNMGFMYAKCMDYGYGLCGVFDILLSGRCDKNTQINSLVNMCVYGINESSFYGPYMKKGMYDYLLVFAGGKGLDKLKGESTINEDEGIFPMIPHLVANGRNSKLIDKFEPFDIEL